MLLFWGQGRLEPQESAHLGPLIHGSCQHHCFGPGTLCLGEEMRHIRWSGGPGAAPSDNQPQLRRRN